MLAMKEKEPDTMFSGIGGPLMQAQGLESLFPMEELSVMGIMEVLPSLKLILKRIKQAIDNIIELSPDKVITIDAPDFSFRVVKGVRKKQSDKTKFVHYVAPTVWAWRPKRAKKISKFLDALICLFDFEPPYFEKEGLKAIAVGHPIMESGVVEAWGGSFREREDIAKDTKTLGVFFGSRKGELKRIAPVFVEAIEKIVEAQPDVELIIPTLPHLVERVTEMLLHIDADKHIVTPSKEEKWETFKACNTSIAVSGTVGLELVASNVPHLIGFNVSTLTHMMLKRLIRVRFAHLANIILDKRIVPEFLQNDCNAELISQKALELLNNEKARAEQLECFQEVRNRIGENKSPSETAANFILQM